MAQARKKSAAAAAKRKTAQEKDLQALRDIADDVIESDFVPYACLYNADTLLTKNGELLHVIKITGHAGAHASVGDLRAALRSVIQRHIPDATYAIWLHTLRRQHDSVGTASFPDGFSRQVDAAWRTQHPASASFTNELTITIAKAGQSAQLGNLKLLLQSIWPKRDHAQRSEYLAQSERELTAVTDAILADLQPYGARRLTVVERDGVFYGEHLEFLEKLINLDARPMPVPRRDLSFALTSGDMTFGYNAMEVRNAVGTRRFATLMTVKEYKESTLAGIDKFLEIPCEFIITQCFDFIDAELARERYEKQAEYLRISGDKEMAAWMEIQRLSGAEVGHNRAFGQQQTSIFLIAPTMKQLEANVRLVQRSFARLGVLLVREDLRIEECYWSQLPGNFPFLSRQHPIDTAHLAGFTNLQKASMGVATDSPWGPPVALLKTINDTPYFFHFHRDQVAHTLLLGRKPAELAGVAHFLLAQARKLPLNLWYLDGNGRGSRFVAAMGGAVATPATASLRLNPMQLPATPANREFLAVWLSTLIDPHATKLNRTSLDYFQSLIDHVLQLPQEQRRLSQLLPLVRGDDPILAQQLQRWCEGGEFGALFDAVADQFSASALQSWNLAAYSDDARVRIPLVSYLLQRMTMALSGKPTLIVLNDALTLLDTPLFNARVAAWLDFIASNNAACMALCQDVGHASSYPYARAFSAKAATIFALPDAQADGEYMLGFDFSESELAAMIHMNAARHDVLMKRGGEPIVMCMNLSSLGMLRSMLAGDAPPTKTPAEILAELMGAGAA